VLGERPQSADDLFEQACEPGELAGTEMSEDRFRHPVHMRIERAQDVAPLLGEADFHDAPILTTANTGDQAPPGEPVDDPRDVRVSSDHAVADFPVRQPGRMTAAQDAQDVVLIGRQVGVGLEERFPRFHDPGGRQPEAEQDFLFSRGEGPRLFQLAGDEA
jgi:hypothetical protein